MIERAHASSIASRVRQVESRIAEAATRRGRSPDEVTLVAVSKTWPVERLVEAWEAGIRHFGENRVQEAADKIAQWHHDRSATWHLVGHLQSNKVRVASHLFDWIQSVDSRRLGEALERAASDSGRRIPILIEVNYAGEPTKFGLPPDEVTPLLDILANAEHLEVRGLMTIAPFAANPEEVRSVFRGMRELRDRLRDRFPTLVLPDLSMGMTEDYEIAIEEGATLVRVGRAIFGPRD